MWIFPNLKLGGEEDVTGKLVVKKKQLRGNPVHPVSKS